MVLPWRFDCEGSLHGFSFINLRDIMITLSLGFAVSCLLSLALHYFFTMSLAR